MMHLSIILHCLWNGKNIILEVHFFSRILNIEMNTEDGGVIVYTLSQSKMYKCVL